jgi:pseudouridine-5'-phosphate glycosidase
VSERARSHVVLANEVRDALLRGRPVVGLETAIVTHGLPDDGGIAAMATAASEVRALGATPASIAVLEGQIRVGLSPADLDQLTSAAPHRVAARDLAAAVTNRWTASMTVSASLGVARLAGIHTLATATVGGVHRGRDLLDISSDIAELAASAVCLVTSGLAPMIDVTRTLELLEAAGVPIVGYRTDRLPLFYVADSPHGVTSTATDPAGVADLCRIHWDLGRRTAVMVVHPPAPGTALDPADVDRWVASALDRAAAAGVRGGALTPFVTEAMHDASDGATGRVYRDVLIANARLAAQIEAKRPTLQDWRR